LEEHPAKTCNELDLLRNARDAQLSQVSSLSPSREPPTISRKICSRVSFPSEEAAAPWRASMPARSSSSEPCASSDHSLKHRYERAGGDGVHTLERLVKEENFWPVNYRGGQRQLLLHAMREVGNESFGAIGELHEFQKLL